MHKMALGDRFETEKFNFQTRSDIITQDKYMEGNNLTK